MTVRAFAPGHISGFFEICLAETEAESGSRGAGICLSHGATATVEWTDTAHEVLVNNHPDGKVTRLALDLLTDTPLRAELILDLPVSQGFGMSGAGTLAATLAGAELLNLPREAAVAAAHTAEVRCATGLGDVVAAARGGLELRQTPGIYGTVQQIPTHEEVVVVTVGPPLRTATILQDKRHRAEIVAAGRTALAALAAAPTLENFFSVSQRFARTTHLMGPTVQAAVQTASAHGHATMCMLGNAVCAVGSTAALMEVLTPFGQVTVCEIDQHGARVL
jgi:pantoate kinase